MKKLILIAIVMSSASLVTAQDFVDNALLFSRVRPGGSARIQAIGGAQVSLGGDYSAALSNPAGLGMYNRSEITLSPALNFSKASSDYFGTTTKDSKSVFNFPGLSLVIRKESGKETGFLGGSFGVSFSRINDFHQNYTISGTNSQSSIIDYFINDANNPFRDPVDMAKGENDFYNLTALAFNNYLIDTLRDNDGFLFYGSPLETFGDPNDIRHVRQTEISERKGVINQWSIAYGANFSDKFFLGANIGITNLKFKLKQTFEERDYFFELDPDYEPLNRMFLEETYDISGNGVNLTIGAIYRVIDNIQVGASLVTPTYYQITDAYEARLMTDWNSFDYYGDGSQILNGEISEEFGEPLLSEYNLTTPMRLTTGITFISKMGFISADVEFVNYSKARYKTDIAEDFDFENKDIKAEYQSVVNYRMGGEYRYDKYRLRLGYNFMADPYRQEGLKEKSINTFSGGLGYRAKNFFIDFAVVHSKQNGTRRPYFVPGEDPLAIQKFTNTNFIFTIGFPF